MQNQMNKYRRLKNLFLRQSYLDAWEDYQRSILKKSFPKWDYIVLTASNEEQGKAFQKQIEYRSEKGVLPDATKFLVIPDPDGKRIGSGGATLHVLRTLSERGFSWKENSCDTFRRRQQTCSAVFRMWKIILSGAKGIAGWKRIYAI